MTSLPDLQVLQGVIVGVFPELASATFTPQARGWDSFAIDVDDSLIFKFPRHEAAQRRLVSEAALLAVIRPAVSLPTPGLTLHKGSSPDGGHLFSRHEKLRGGHFEPDVYAGLSEQARDRLAQDLALFYAQLHALPAAAIELAGAKPVMPWLEPDEILRRSWPVLDERLRGYAERTIDAWRTVRSDPHGSTFGFFDGHGWNMAFDAEAGQLNGIYDFGDAGFGLLQQEFIYSNMIAADLTGRIIDRYEGLTGRQIDRERVALLFQVLRLSELAEAAEDAHLWPSSLDRVRSLSEAGSFR
jgi:aminoglycoside phosphotransferase (APT) family kinase protein